MNRAIAYGCGGVKEREENEIRREQSRGQLDGGLKGCRLVFYMATMTEIPSSSKVHIQGLVTLADRDADIQIRSRTD